MSHSKFVELKTPKDLDIISELKFLPARNHLLATTWDNRVLLYDCTNTDNPELVSNFETKNTILSIAHNNVNSTFVGCIDGSVRELDYENMQISRDNLLNQETGDTGRIDKGINNLCIVPGNPYLLISSSFDGGLLLIDTRIRKPIQSRQLSSKIFKMATTDKYLTVTLKANKIEIYDLNNLLKPIELRELGLKYQINDIEPFPNNEGFAVCTIDGRVSLEYFDPSIEVQMKKRFTFKCHRSHDKLTDTDIVSPINSIAIHRTYQTLFTAGSDGYLCLWDCEKRKRIKMYSRFVTPENTPESIAKIDLSHDNHLIAVGTSDDSYASTKNLLSDPNSFNPSKIYLRELGEKECMPKSS